ncbi:MAG: thiamine pyrophosphate-dependent dehydrogenase E1 component subunit alpha [Gammaproteobacteria bacterium]|uniref:thiamine pyrophosphate-dependent dehydrogenase E1 component subunit alpha n=1 Tax=Pseudomaricurvus alcaniphilus TaxID=1166482 RepID=UPI00140C82D2|nr:thiamine pyrophosphate-dependent dehydrogenase E1 component subunit alpha [Pseudomaricurvus alcaniphilus]MBR9911378.1 thiamine pyrophosphate-dependent dehydrogenase E1 component subunit alpha [Gammaproteobacteria bacterium]NHN36832.1 thiamine pyrophosphate-dependent dehydrogenase E1 component subunit alpha [Pseudomaricurvus alcaniphilus]
MPIDTTLIGDMYRRMSIARAIEQIVEKHTRKARISGWWHPGEGQEAVGVGASAALNGEDYLWYQGRGCAWAIGKGMQPGPILGDVLGKVSGATGGKGGGVPHWADYSLGIMGEGATLGSVYPLAAGSAFASKLRKDGRVSLANFGDGTASRGTFHETMVHAATWKLPLIYLCENNELLVGTKLTDVCPTADIADFAKGYGIPGIIVDGQDAVAVYEATLEAAARARAGEGPTLIEAKTTRVQGHYAGDPQNYRAKDALANYRDPLAVLAERMAVDEVETIAAEALALVQAAYEETLAAPPPDHSIIFKDLYYGQ